METRTYEYDDETARARLTLWINTGRWQHPAGMAHDTWNTEQLRKDFTVLGFLAPFCFVRRKDDGQWGSVLFRHMPRVYFDFVPFEANETNQYDHLDARLRKEGL